MRQELQNGGHLDRFGTGPEDAEDGLHAGQDTMVRSIG